MPEYAKGFRTEFMPTKRELQMLSMAARGMSNAGIAFELDLTKTTVANTLGSCYRKLDAEDRTNAVFKALRLGWLDRDTAAPAPKVIVLIPQGSPPVEVIYIDHTDGRGKTLDQRIEKARASAVEEDEL